MITTKSYIFPPRPAKNPIPIAQIGIYSKLGWVAQLKYNGKRTEISLDGDETIFHTRHKSVHASNVVPSYIVQEMAEVRQRLGLSADAWQYFDGETLVHKNKWLGGFVVLWDLLVANGDWRLGTKYSARYEQLAAIAIGPFEVVIGGQKFDIGLKLTEHIFVPHLFTDLNAAWEFTQKVNAAAGWKEGPGAGEPVLEGLVAKDMNGTLEPGFREENNTTWSVRCRVRTGRHRV